MALETTQITEHIDLTTYTHGPRDVIFRGDDAEAYVSSNFEGLAERTSPQTYIPPAGNRTNLRSTVEVGVWRIPMDVQYKAMGGCRWMERAELSAAIPPAYSEHIARAAQDHIRGA